MVSAPYKRAEVWLPLLAASAFLPSLAGAFVYDDVRLIADNAYVQSPQFWARAFTTDFWDVSSAAPAEVLLRLYRPLVTLSYLGNWLLGLGQAWTFHLTNVLLHALSTGLFLLIALRLTRSRPLGVACALLFALHPTRSESVTWVSGRPDPLMTAFVLLTVQFAYWGRRQSARPIATLLVVLSFCAALLSKEPALATPLLLLADAGDTARSERTGHTSSERAWQLSMVALTASLGVAYLVLRHHFLPVGSPPLVWTPGQALITVSNYAERAFFPWPLTFFYQLEETGAGARSPLGDVALGAVITVGMIAWAAVSWRRDRTAFWLLCAGLALLGPLLNLFQTGSRFITSDRFLYLPLGLLALAACRSLAGPLALAAQRREVRLVALGLLTVYGAANVTRALDFANKRTFWQSELATNPDNPVALRGLAAQQLAQGDPDGAIQNLARSLQAPALRYRRVVTASDNADSYGRLLALAADRIPDGSVAALSMLVQDAVDRLAGKLRQARSQTLPIGWPEDGPTVNWVATHAEETIAGHLSPVVTRLDLHDIAQSLLDAVPDERLHLAPNPLLIALGEAREQRFARATRRIDVLRQDRHLMPKNVSEAALVDLEGRISVARELFASAKSLGVDEGRLARARAFASLGAFLRALLEVQQVDPRHPAMRPLYVQLLVSARLESAALQVASQALGSERARWTIDAIRSQLPPDLRALPPVELAPAVATSPAL